MIIDSQNRFCDAQTIAGTDTTVISTNVIDLGPDNSLVKTLNEKGMIELIAQVAQSFTGGTSVEVILQKENSAAFGAPIEVVTCGPIVISNLVKGFQFHFSNLPLLNKRYIRLAFIIVGTTTGVINANLVLDRQGN